MSRPVTNPLYTEVAAVWLQLYGTAVWMLKYAVARLEQNAGKSRAVNGLYLTTQLYVESHRVYCRSLMARVLCHSL